MQARAFAEMAGGGDLVVNAATGSGKGLLLALPAAAVWHAAEPGTLVLVDLVIVPYKALGIHLEKTFNALFRNLANEGRMRPGARALFVRRSQRADSAEEPEPDQATRRTLRLSGVKTELVLTPHPPPTTATAIGRPRCPSAAWQLPTMRRPRS